MRVVCKMGGFGRIGDSASTRSKAGMALRQAQRPMGSVADGLSDQWAQRRMGSATDGKPMSGAVSTSEALRRRSQT